MTKRLTAILLSFAALLMLCAGCAPAASSGAGSAAAKDYTQILHDARPSEDNDYYMIFSGTPGGDFTAQYGYSADYSSADELNSEIQNFLLPLLALDEGSYTELAASVSAMMIKSYGIAIVKPAEGKTAEVEAALNAFVASQQQTMQNYLPDQYEIAKAAKVETAPTGEVILVCCENSAAVLANIKEALGG